MRPHTPRFRYVCLALVPLCVSGLAAEANFAGMTLTDLTAPQLAQVEQAYGEPAGVAITAVAPGSLAEQSCIAAGDILLSVRLPNHTDYYPLEPDVEVLAAEPWLKDVNEKTRLMILRKEDGQWTQVKALLGQPLGTEVPEGLLEGDEGELMAYEAGKGYVFSPPDPDAVIAKAPGGEELLARDVDMWGALLAWSFGTCLTEEQRQVVSISLAASWKNADPGEVQSFYTNFRTGPKQIPNLSQQQKEAARSYYANGFVQVAQQSPNSPLGQLVMQVADRSRQVLASAGPGVDLTQQDVDAFLEYIVFQVQLATAQPLALGPEDHQKLTAEIITQFRQATPDQQQVLANMSPIWTEFRRRWDKMQADQANAIAQQWQQAYQQQAGNQAAGNAWQQGVQNAQGTYAGIAANTPPAGDGNNLDQHTMDILKDVMRMDHETSMTIIDNIGGGPSTDVYDSDGIYLYSY